MAWNKLPRLDLTRSIFLYFFWIRTNFCWQHSLCPLLRWLHVSRYSIYRWYTNYRFFWGQVRAALQWVKNNIWNVKCRSINHMEGFVSASVGIFDNFLKTMVWPIASLYLVLWICNPSSLVKNIHPFLKIVQNIGGCLGIFFILPTQDLICPIPVLSSRQWLWPFIQRRH